MPPWYHTGCQVIDPEIKNQGGLEMNYTQNRKISQVTPSTRVSQDFVGDFLSWQFEVIYPFFGICMTSAS